MIKLLILDIDGVMTDGTKLYNLEGKVVAKSFNDKDFTAIKILKNVGIEVCFLSGDDRVNKKIAEDRHIDFYYTRDKKEYLKFLIDQYSVKLEEIAFVGDDYYDIEIMDNVGNSFCPEDSPSYVKEHCVVLNKKGGEGVVTELLSHLIKHEGIRIDV